MNQKLNERARCLIAAARQEALSFNHCYIGTEHLLLALMQAEFRETANVLKTFGVDATQIRQQVVQLVHRGPSPIADREIPLTPRARYALEIAAEEARDANQREVDASHVLLGLMREPEGVAGKVLVGLGLNLNEVREAVLKIRHEQMKLVERTVRPIQASPAKKRKLREELLAHLTGIYEEELTRLVNPTAALRAATERFGDPATLAGEFNGSLPWTERANYFFSQSLGWHPPETASHYNLRFAGGMTAFVTVFLFCCLLPAGAFLKDGWGAMLILTRPLIVVLPFLFIDSFLFGLLYFKLRDAIFGAPWARKSFHRAALYLGLIALVAYASAAIFTTIVNSNPAQPASFAYVSFAAVALAAIGFPLVAFTNGQSQISDAVWASLDVRTSPREIAS